MKKLLILLIFLFTTPSFAGVQIDIDKRRQIMEVFIDNEPIYKWKVSTGKKGHSTPSGTFYVQSMEIMHYSRLYENAPMPYSIFFNGNIAIHGTNSISNLGRPVSHGCTRISPSNAATLYNIVKKYRNDTIITVN